MILPLSATKFSPCRRVLLLLACVAIGLASSAAAGRSENLPVVPKWARFEQSLTSSVTYSNPPQQTVLTALFTSPVGETTPVYGFWDGGKTWRVRFSPDQPGRWSFKTTCSDPENRGLQQSGAFLCTANAGQNRFSRHGPVRVARDHRHFEHADGTPFLWIADTAWSAARISNLADWSVYAQIRTNQNFSVIQWSADPPGNESIINPEFFRRFDFKIDVLNRCGLLSAIAPVWPNSRTAPPMSAPQLAAWLRYAVARFGADNVAWLIAPS